MDSVSQNGDGPDTTTRYEGYADYQTVSAAITRSIDDALDAYATLESLHTENAKVQTDHAVRARSRILSAALKLVPELRDDAAAEEQYREILARWQGGFEIVLDEDGDEVETVRPDFSEFDGLDTSTGFLGGLKNVHLQRECPDWLYQLVIDIRTAGWELGYLRAGRTRTERDLEPADEAAASMFD